MTPEEKRLADWKDTLWGAWEEGRRLSRRQLSLATVKAAFYSAFDAGRESVRIVPKAKKEKKPERKA